MAIMKVALAAVALLLLSACATPYQDMGFLGGVTATQITADTFQIAARGNGYTSADVIERYALRKAAETTVGAGYDLFLLGAARDRTRVGSVTTASANVYGGSAYGSATTFRIVKPGETVMVKMFKGAKPADAPENLYDAREVLKYMTPPPKP
jgi:hypothetical protein